MTGLRFSLFTKIMIWFFLNLIVLLAVFAILFSLDFRIGRGAPFLAPVNRLDTISRAITSETQDLPRAERDAVIQKYAAQNRVGLFIFDEEGTQIGGSPTVLPAEIAERLSRRMPVPVRDNAGMPGGGRPLAPFFYTRTSNPALYWSSAPIFIFENGKAEPTRGRMIVSSDSMTGRGLFFNPWPLVASIAVVIFVSTLFWFPFVRRLTKSLARLDDAAKKIADEDFSVRVRESRTDELGHLGASINHLAKRLEGFVGGQRRFLGDISHELNSPLARMQFALSILEDRGGEKNLPYVRDVKEEVELMSKLVGELLTYSKAGIKAAAVELEKVALLPLVTRIAERERIGTEAEIKIHVDSAIEVHAQPELLARAIGNILRNAVRYAGADGPIAISALQENGLVEISVTDCGNGVPSETIEKLFDPFYRVESHRSRDTGGSGLGLAIVKTCIESCGGRVSAANLAPKGFEVKILLKA